MYLRDELIKMKSRDLLAVAEAFEIKDYEAFSESELVDLILAMQADDSRAVASILMKHSLDSKKAKRYEYKIEDEEPIVPEDVINKFSASVLNAASTMGLTPENENSEPDEVGFPQLRISVEPGKTSKEELADLLADISKIYRKMGGSGIVFKLDSVTVNQKEAYEL